MDEWHDIAVKIMAALKEKKAEFKHAAQLDDDEEESVLTDAVAVVLHHEYLDGRLHLGPET